MTVRSGMYDLIQTLRELCNAGEDDFTLGAQTYWSRQHLQTALDKRGCDVRGEMLQSFPEKSGTIYVYHDFYLPSSFIEGGTAAFVLLDNLGGTYAPTAYTVDLDKQRVTFTANMTSTPVFANYRIFDMNLAAADVWKRKASFYTEAYDVSTDNHSLKRSQLVAQCERKAREFEAMAGPTSISVVRSDT